MHVNGQPYAYREGLTLHALLAELRAKVEAEAPPEKREPALSRVEELKETLTSDEPDPTTLELVKRWFVKNVPKLAGAVASFVVNPIVGKVVEAAGEGLSAAVREKFPKKGE
jgi:hypothetical protein